MFEFIKNLFSKPDTSYEKTRPVFITPTEDKEEKPHSEAAAQRITDLLQEDGSWGTWKFYESRYLEDSPSENFEAWELKRERDDLILHAFFGGRSKIEIVDTSDQLRDLTDAFHKDDLQKIHRAAANYLGRNTKFPTERPSSHDRLEKMVDRLNK